MVENGEEERDTIRTDFDRSMMIDFQGAKITSDTGFLLLREIDERFGILGPMESELADARSWVHSKHTQLQMVRQFYLMGEEIKRSMEWVIKRLIRVAARVAYHGRRWQVDVASAFPLAKYYRAVFG